MSNLHFNRIVCLFSLTALLLTISACTPMQVSQNQQEQWRIEGKLGVTTPDDRMSGFLIWEQNANQYRIHVSGPLGQGTTEIEGDLENVTLTQDGKSVSSNNPQELIYEQMGWFFPLESLKYWVVGKAAPFSQAEEKRDSDGRLEKLQQDNWKVEYFRYDAYAGLPSRLRISQGDWRFLLVIKHWSLG